MRGREEAGLAPEVRRGRAADGRTPDGPASLAREAALPGRHALVTPVQVAVDRSRAMRQRAFRGRLLGFDRRPADRRRESRPRGWRAARGPGRDRREGRVQSHARVVAPAKLGSLRRAGAMPSEGSIMHGWEPLWSAERLGRWSHTVRGSPESRNCGQRYPRGCARTAGTCRPAKPLLLIIDTGAPRDQRHHRHGHIRSDTGDVGRLPTPGADRPCGGRGSPPRPWAPGTRRIARTTPTPCAPAAPGAASRGERGWWGAVDGSGD